MKKNSLLPIILAYAMMGKSDSPYPKSDITDDLYTKPQSDDSKKYWLAQAEKKRIRKNTKRNGGLKNG